MGCCNDTYNRQIPLHYRNSTKSENVKKFVFDHKICYHLITFFNSNFLRASHLPIPQHNSV